MENTENQNNPAEQTPEVQVNPQQNAPTPAVPVQPAAMAAAAAAQVDSNPGKSGSPISIDSLMNVKMDLVVEVGRAKMSLRELLEIQKGSVVELDRSAGDVVDILVNDLLIAKGEVVLVDDKFGVKITQVISPEQTMSAVNGQ